MSVVLGQVKKVGDKFVSDEKVVYVQEDWYITSRTRKVDGQILYAVYKDGTFWRDQKYPKELSVNYDHCMEYLLDRPSIRRSNGVVYP